jgi:hypothetical protein
MDGTLQVAPVPLVRSLEAVEVVGIQVKAAEVDAAI